MVTGLISMRVALPVIWHVVDVSQDDTQQLLRAKHHVLIGNKRPEERERECMREGKLRDGGSNRVSGENGVEQTGVRFICGLHAYVNVYMEYSRYIFLSIPLILSDQIKWFNSPCAFTCTTTAVNVSLPADCDTHSK